MSERSLLRVINIGFQWVRNDAFPMLQRLSDSVFGRDGTTPIDGGLMFRFRAGSFISLVLIGVFVCFTRNPAAFILPDLVNEDASEFFSGAYNLGLFKSLLETYSGYHHTLSRIVAWINVAIFPLEWIPLTFAISGSLVGSLALSSFFLPGFRHIVARDVHRYLIVVILFLAPNADNLILVFGLHWYGLFWLSLVLFMRAPSSRCGIASLIILGLVAIASSPVAVVLLPFFAIRLITARSIRERIWSATWVLGFVGILGLFVFQRWGSDREVWIPRVLDIGDLITAFINGVSYGWVTTTVSGRWIEVFSTRQVDPRWSYLIAVLVIAALVAGLWRRRSTISVSASVALWALLGLAMVGMIALRPVILHHLLEFDTHKNERYFTAPTLLLLIGIGALLCSDVENLSRRRMVTYLGVLWLFVLVHFAMLPPIKGFGGTGFPRIIPAIRDFERRIENGRPGEHLRLPTGAFPVTITKWGDRVVPSPPASVETFFIDVEDLGGGRYRSSWFGSFDASEWPRIVHPVFGLVTAFKVEGGRYWFVTGGAQYFWTAPLFYPERLRTWFEDGRYWQVDETNRLWAIGNDGIWYHKDAAGRYWTLLPDNQWVFRDTLP